MTAGLATEIVGDESSFAALAPEWWALWRRCRGATPFQSPAWLIPWWRHFHPGDLFVVAVRRERRLVGLAPFYIEDGTRRILPVGISVSDYLDVLLDPDETSAGPALVQFIAGEGRRWDEWSLEELPPGAAALALPAPQGCEEQLAPQSVCPVLVLPDDKALFEPSLGPRQKRNLRLARNRASRRGEIIVEQGAAETVTDILDWVFRLHAARWESRGEAGVLADDLVRAFHREAAPALMKEGLLRLYVLRIGGAPAAAHYGFTHRERAFAYLTGLDPDFAFESPGTILLAHALEQGIAEGAREFHFLRGPEAYKYAWGGTDRWNMRRVFRRRQERAAHA